MLNEAELQGGATGLVQWKEHEAAQAEAERKRKAEEAAKARAEYEAAKAAARVSGDPPQGCSGAVSTLFTQRDRRTRESANRRNAERSLSAHA